MREEGCYLALLRRREISHLDSKQMIKMAEARGLFSVTMSSSRQEAGSASTAKKKRKGILAKCIIEIRFYVYCVLGKVKSGRRNSFHVERVGAQTHCSMMRSIPAGTLPTCPRNSENQPTDGGTSPARQWWAETARYLTRLRKALVRQRLLASEAVRAMVPGEDELLRDIRNIDELLSKGPTTPSRLSPKIPVFPRLRLTRNTGPPERIPFPVYNCSVELPERQYY